MQEYFQQVFIDLGFHFQSWKLFLDYFRFQLLTTAYKEIRYQKLFCLLIPIVKTTKLNLVFTNSAVKMQHVLFGSEPFLCKTLVLFFFISNIPLYIERTLWKNYVRKWNLKCRPKLAQNSFSVDVQHYIQHCFIRQCLGLNKEQTSMFKSFLIKALINRKKIVKRCLLSKWEVEF